MNMNGWFEAWRQGPCSNFRRARRRRVAMAAEVRWLEPRLLLSAGQSDSSVYDPATTRFVEHVAPGVFIERFQALVDRDAAERRFPRLSLVTSIRRAKRWKITTRLRTGALC